MESTAAKFLFCFLPGLSPDLQSMEQIRRIMRPTDVPDQGLLCDLLWSDPDKETMGWGENDRGVSFTFGAEVVAKFLHKHDLDLICRAHQVNCFSFKVVVVVVECLLNILCFFFFFFFFFPLLFNRRIFIFLLAAIRIQNYFNELQ